MQISTKAAQGDHRASRELFSLVERSELAVNAGSASKSLPETDQTVMEMILRRVERSATRLRGTRRSMTGETSK